MTHIELYLPGGMCVTLTAGGAVGLGLQVRRRSAT